MDGHVDWLSWTMKPSRQPENHQELYHIGRRALRSLSDEHDRWLFDGQGYDRAARISTFNICLARDDNGVRLGGQSPTELILWEATGRACDAITEPARSRRIVSEVAAICTRFDYAVDIHTSTRPNVFANARSHNAFRSISFIRSDSGETVYVGSPKSDRFCRVYRYNPPHPRSDLLRIEYVFRRGMARAAAVQYCERESDEYFLASLGNTWGFNHREWRPAAKSDERINAPSVKKHDEDTIMWLYKQVSPAVRRVLESGSLDIADWIQTFYPESEEFPEDSTPRP